jgi:hypothetical protein
VRNRIPANHSHFNHFDRCIISIDTLTTEPKPWVQVLAAMHHPHSE